MPPTRTERRNHRRAVQRVYHNRNLDTPITVPPNYMAKNACCDLELGLLRKFKASFQLARLNNIKTIFHFEPRIILAILRTIGQPVKVITNTTITSSLTTYLTAAMKITQGEPMDYDIDLGYLPPILHVIYALLKLEIARSVNNLEGVRIELGRGPLFTSLPHYQAMEEPTALAQQMIDIMIETSAREDSVEPVNYLDVEAGGWSPLQQPEVAAGRWSPPSQSNVEAGRQSPPYQPEVAARRWSLPYQSSIEAGRWSPPYRPAR